MTSKLDSSESKKDLSSIFHLDFRCNHGGQDLARVPFSGRTAL